MCEIFCEILEENEIQDFNNRKDNDLSIKIYKIELLKLQKLTPSLESFLSSIEYKRANKYHFTKDKNRFIICRAILKLLLAEETGLEANNILIDYHANKKPYLRSHPTIHFNISHTDDYAIIAISKTSLIGVDIEHIAYGFDFKDILSSVFTKSEIKNVLDSKNKHHTFYKLWTRKEAVAKTIGKGIDDYLSKVEMLDGYNHTGLELLNGIKNLQVFSFFELGKDYIGAIAIPETPKNKIKMLFYQIPINFQELLKSK